LKDATSEGDQVTSDQRIACSDVVIERHFEQVTDFIITVKGDPVFIAYGHQEIVEQEFIARECPHETATDEPVVNPAEGTGYSPNAVWVNGSFL
jgi:hypothetical protein